MSIHTKSLNQLAYELEVLPRLRREQQRRDQQQREQAASPVTKGGANGHQDSLREVLRYLGDLRQQLEQVTKTAEPARSAATTAPAPTAPAPQTSSGDFIAGLDGSFGLRTRGEERSALRKSEDNVRLYSAFASRADITDER